MRITTLIGSTSDCEPPGNLHRKSSDGELLGHGSKSFAASCEAPQACPVVGACACGAEGAVPCLDIARVHQGKLHLCAAMEAIADALPSAVDRMECLRIASELVPLLRESHRYEEETIFPVFEKVQGASHPARAASVRRLQAEHVEDECAAQDLTEVLLEIGHGAAVDNPEALGFMLRAFFETLRRHIAFEREHILPIVTAQKCGTELAARSGCKTRHVVHCDSAIVLDVDSTVGPQLRELAADRLDGESEKVADVGPDKRQGEGRSLAIGRCRRVDVARNEQQEAGDPLARGLAAERQHPIARLVQLLHRLLQYPTFQLGRLRDHSIHGRLRNEHSETPVAASALIPLSALHRER